MAEPDSLADQFEKNRTRLRAFWVGGVPGGRQVGAKLSASGAGDGTDCRPSPGPWRCAVAAVSWLILPLAARAAPGEYKEDLSRTRR